MIKVKLWKGYRQGIYFLRIKKLDFHLKSGTHRLSGLFQISGKHGSSGLCFANTTEMLSGHSSQKSKQLWDGAVQKKKNSVDSKI